MYLQDELRGLKANGVHPVDSSEGHSAAWIRRSLNLIKASLNCSISLRRVDEDGDEEMEIDEEAVEKLCIQVGKQSESSEAHDTMNKAEIVKSELQIMGSEFGSTKDPQHQCSEDIDVKMEEGLSEQDEDMIVDCDKSKM